MKATPRLSEDKVKQCVDPKLGEDYPPKAVAKVTRPCSLLLTLGPSEHTLVSQDSRFFFPVSVGSGGGVVRAVRVRFPAEHDHRGEGVAASCQGSRSRS
jgi:hypothetical protein